jgi:hypothetical protein
MNNLLEPRLKASPGIILGPEESLQAVLMCLAESIDASYSNGRELVSGIADRLPD